MCIRDRATAELHRCSYPLIHPQAVDESDLDPLQNRRVRHPAAFADRLKSIAGIRTLHLMHQRRHEFGTRTSEGMPESDRSPIDIGPLPQRVWIFVHLDEPRPKHRGERFVDFESANLIQVHARTVKDLCLLYTSPS